MRTCYFVRTFKGNTETLMCTLCHFVYIHLNYPADEKNVVQVYFILIFQWKMIALRVIYPALKFAICEETWGGGSHSGMFQSFGEHVRAKIPYQINT